MANIKWEGKRDATTIETVSKERMESLYVSSLKLIFYLNVNFLYNLRKFVNDISTCDCFAKPKNLCNICSLLEKYDVNKIEKDYRQKAIVETNIALTNDLKKMPEIEVSRTDYKFTNCFFSELIFIPNSTARERIEVKKLVNFVKRTNFLLRQSIFEAKKKKKKKKKTSKKKSHQK